jgi:hypothetical protein
MFCKAIYFKFWSGYWEDLFPKEYPGPMPFFPGCARVRTGGGPAFGGGARLPIQLALRYRVIVGQRIAQMGTGRTCDISRTGVLFEPESMLDTGSSVELFIDWPAPYHGKEPMALLVRGTIIRFEDNRAALKVLYHDFIPFLATQTLEAAPIDIQLNAPRAPRTKRKAD